MTARIVLALLLVAAPCLTAQTLVFPTGDSPVLARYAAFLQHETEARAAVRWTIQPRPDSQTTVVIATEQQIPTLLPPASLASWRAQFDGLHPTPSAEGYSVISVGKTLVLTATEQRGELFAIGWLLRKARFSPGHITLPETRPFTTGPEKAIRGYQVGYRMKNNTYDGWTLQQFEQQMLDLAVFGLNTIQVIAPLSDDAPTSPLFPAPAEETVIGLSRLSQQLDLRFDLFYPEMANDYADPAQADAELRQFEDLVRKLPLVDSIHVPGGDPGHTPPEILLPLLERETAILHRYHPNATVWVSAQGFTAERYARFYELLAARPAWLTGVFFGPQSRESMEQQRARIPGRYPIEFYPDTAHVMHAQFPIPQWDPIFALTEGREPINPRPAAFERIYRHFNGIDSGFMVYSEGVNDDINKALWGGWGWSAQTPFHTILRDYARYFFAADDKATEAIARGIEGLEQNWTGSILTNSHIPQTLSAFDHTPPLSGWRWTSLLYRATYDRYLQLKRARELAAEETAVAALRGPEPSPAKARQALSGSIAREDERRLRDDLFRLAKSLFDETKLQLSVKLYGASNVERGANLDRVDTPLNDRVWLERALADAEQRPTEPERLKALHAIASWTQPQPDALYDDLGDPEREPHLVRGAGWSADPEMYHTAIDGIADQTLEKAWRLSWLDYAETLYEEPLRLHYDRLTPSAAYSVRITYAGETYKLPMRLVANGKDEIQPSRPRRENPEVVEYALPPSATSAGSLTLEWSRPYGSGGSGRGGQVAEVWLLKAQP